MAALERPLIDVYEHTGAINAKRLADELGFTVPQVARAIGRAPSTLSRNGTAPSAQGELAALAGLMTRVAQLFAGDVPSARIWLHAPHQELNYRRPMDLLLERRRRVVESLVGNLEEGAPN